MGFLYLVDTAVDEVGAVWAMGLHLLPCLQTESSFEAVITSFGEEAVFLLLAQVPYPPLHTGCDDTGALSTTPPLGWEPPHLSFHPCTPRRFPSGLLLPIQRRRRCAAWACISWRRRVDTRACLYLCSSQARWLRQPLAHLLHRCPSFAGCVGCRLRARRGLQATCDDGSRPRKRTLPSTV